MTEEQMTDLEAVQAYEDCMMDGQPLPEKTHYYLIENDLMIERPATAEEIKHFIDEYGDFHPETVLELTQKGAALCSKY